MVVNRKKLRNRIFKISFSFVISALAIVLGLSVRSNAKAESVVNLKSSPFNSYLLGLNDYESMKLPISMANKFGISLSSNSSTWRRFNDSTYNYQKYLNFVGYHIGKTLTIACPLLLYTNEIFPGSYYLPNLIRFCFGGFDYEYEGDYPSLDLYIASYISAEFPNGFETFENLINPSSTTNERFNCISSSTSAPSNSRDIGSDAFFSYSDVPFNIVSYPYNTRDTYYRNNIVYYQHFAPSNLQLFMQQEFEFYTENENHYNLDENSSYGGVYGILMFSLVLSDGAFWVGNSFQNYIPYINYNYFPRIEILHSNYQNGFNNGVESVNTEQYYDNGFNAGFNAGQSSIDVNAIAQNNYTSGYNAGLLASSHDYGIKDLLYSIFDVPINVLSNLFSFTIFGTNVWAIIVSLLTIVVVLWIVSKVLGIVFSGGGKK